MFSFVESEQNKAMGDSPMKEKEKTTVAGEFHHKNNIKNIWFKNGRNQNMKEENV